MRLGDRFATTVFFVALSSAASAAERNLISIPATSLGQAGALLGRQAHVSVGISDPVIAHLKVRRVAGTMTVNQALAQMLRGLPARVVAIDHSTFLIVAVSTGLRAPLPPPKRSSGRLSTAPRRRPVTVAEADSRPAEIIVTASKRQLRLESYPAESAVVAGDEMVRGRGLAGSDAILARLPLVSSTYLGPGRNKLFIRGIADSSFNGPTQTTVAQYFGEARLNFTAPDPDLRLYDVQRIELLAGPQASLYGAGSLGGVIRIVPNPPDLESVSGRLSIGASTTAHGAPGSDAAGSLNLPLVPGSAGLRLVAYHSDDGGYIDDQRRRLSNINSVHVTGGRISARAKLSDWTVDLGGLAQKIGGDDAQFSNHPSNPLTTESAVPQNYSNHYSLASVTVRKEQPLLVVLTGALSRQSLHERYYVSGEDQALLFLQHTKGGVASLEARVSHTKNEHSGWLSGISVVQNDYQQTRVMAVPDVRREILPGLRNRTTEIAAFGELTHPIFGGVDITAGARLALSDISGVVLNSRKATATERRKQTFFLPSIALSGHPTQALFLYARYQQGFRAGGFSIFADTVERYRPDRMDAFEFGGRLASNDESLPRIDASLGYTRWRDVQADTLNARGIPTTVNAGDGKLYMASVQMSWKLSSSLEIETAAVLNESHLTNPSTTFASQLGHPPLPNVPRLNARAAARFTRQLPHFGDFSLVGSMRYVGKSQLGAGPVLGREQGGWLEADADAAFVFGIQRLTLNVTNLFGVVGNRFAFGSPFTIGQSPQVTPLRPRTIRIGWDVNF